MYNYCSICIHAAFVCVCNMEIGQALDARVYHLVVQVYVTTITTPL